MPPSVGEASQVGRTAPPVGVEHDRQFGDPQSLSRGADHHFTGELHPGTSQSQAADPIAAESPQPTVKVAASGSV